MDYAQKEFASCRYLPVDEEALCATKSNGQQPAKMSIEVNAERLSPSWRRHWATDQSYYFAAIGNHPASFSPAPLKRVGEIRDIVWVNPEYVWRKRNRSIGSKMVHRRKIVVNSALGDTLISQNRGIA